MWRLPTAQRRCYLQRRRNTWRLWRRIEFVATGRIDETTPLHLAVFSRFLGGLRLGVLPRVESRTGGIKGAKDAASKDGGSLRVLLGGMWIALFLAFPLAFVRAWSFPQRAQVPFFIAGLLLIVLGSLLRRYCFRTLGQYFTGDVRAREDQPVICTGPYRWVRHPSYTAGMMMFIGIGLALGSWFSFLLLTIGSIATYGYRVAVEERLLLQTLGEPYASYMKGRRRFIPHIV